MNQQYGNQNFRNNQFNNQQQQQFNQGGFQQGVAQQQLDRIHQNSLFNGQEASYNNPQVQRIHQQSMQNGTMANPQANNYGQQQQGFNQGFQQGVSQQQLDRIHQASLYGGQSQPENAYVERIHQSTMQGGTMAQPQLNNYNGGTSSMMGMGMGTMGAQNFGGQTNSYNQQQQFQQGVSQQQLDRIHQASLYGGQSQPENAYVERIHQSTMQGGTMAQPQLNNYNGGGSMMGMGTMGMGTMGSQQQFQQGVAPQQLERIHQASMQNGTMANSQVNSYGNTYGAQQGFAGQQGFGGQSMGMGMNGAAFNQVMAADAGIRDAEGRTDLYSQSLYTGRNQYDTVNANVLNQMTNQMSGRQF